eukprot:Skav220328  [mRNA]  locus=scaffold972:403511:407447:- [translate_table: standard]
MWGTRLHTSPNLSGLKRAFEQLTHDVFNAIKMNPVPCGSAVILLSLFANASIQGRERRSNEHFINYKYTGQAGCGILILSDWQAKAAKAAAENNTEKDTWWDWLFSYQQLYSWRVVPFATDEFLKNIGNESKSNEIQRLSKLLKSAVPLYVPPDVQRVTYADAKCKLDMFFNMSSRTDLASGPPADIVTLQHPDRFQSPFNLKDEFTTVRQFMTKRNELPPVHSDIDRLEKFLGQELLNKTVDMPDIMCMTWQRSKAVETFARRWFWYIATFSMRGQLSWSPAMFDCGEGLRVFLYPERPSKGRNRRLEDGQERTGVAEATGMTADVVVNECRTEMGKPNKRPRTKLTL